MIASLQGKIILKKENFVILEVAGVGYKVFCSPYTLKKLSQDSEIKLFTFLVSKENTTELYGFLTMEELALFETLNEISGIGPKTAMLLASLGSLEKLKGMIEKDQLPKEIKGIGRKKAQKILLELTGQINELGKSQRVFETDEALDALISLGISRQKAKVVLSQLPQEITDTETKIKKALEYLGGK